MGNSGSFSNKDFHGHSLIMNKREYDKCSKYTFLYDTRLRALDLEEYWSNGSRGFISWNPLYMFSWGLGLDFCLP